MPDMSGFVLTAMLIGFTLMVVIVGLGVALGLRIARMGRWEEK